MTTLQQLTANRRNAQKSTGPRTPEGKVHAQFNALRHGLYARDVVLPCEDRDAYETLLYTLSKDLAPEGPVETRLVQRAGDLWWRLERTASIEAGVLNPDWHGPSMQK